MGAFGNGQGVWAVWKKNKNALCCGGTQGGWLSCVMFVHDCLGAYRVLVRRSVQALGKAVFQAA